LAGAINKRNSARFVRAWIHVNVADDRVGNERAIPSLQRILHRGERTAEVRVSHAAALARATIMTRGASIVRLRQNGGATNGDGAPKFFLNAVTQANLSTAHFHGRKKLSIRQHLIAFCSAGDPDVALDDIVIRRYISIGEWPIDIVSVSTGGFEIDIAQTITLASPN